MHSLAEMHETPSRPASSAPLGSDMGDTDHPSLVMRSATGTRIPAVFRSYPTAIHAVVEAHETPVNATCSPVPSGNGSAFTDHGPPFQVSAIGSCRPEL